MNRLYDEPSPDPLRYATLLEEALAAFEQDIMYAIAVIESAHALSNKKYRNTRKKK